MPGDTAVTRRDKSLIVALVIALLGVFSVTAVTLAMQVRHLNAELAADHAQSDRARETLYDHLSSQDCEIITILTTSLPAAETAMYMAQAGCRG